MDQQSSSVADDGGFSSDGSSAGYSCARSYGSQSDMDQSDISDILNTPLPSLHRANNGGRRRGVVRSRAQLTHSNVSSSVCSTPSHASRDSEGSSGDNSFQTIFSRESTYRSVMSHGGRRSNVGSVDSASRTSEQTPYRVPPPRAFTPLEALAECVAPTEGSSGATGTGQRRRRRRGGSRYNYMSDGFGGSCWSSLSNGTRLLIFGSIVYVFVFLTQREIHINVEFNMGKRGHSALNGDVDDEYAETVSSIGTSTNAEDDRLAAAYVQRRQKVVPSSAQSNRDIHNVIQRQQQQNLRLRNAVPSSSTSTQMQQMQMLPKGQKQKQLKMKLPEGKEQPQDRRKRKKNKWFGQQKQRQETTGGNNISQAPPVRSEISTATLKGRPLRILSLGGSNTWGSQLSDRSEAYPTVLSSLCSQNSNGNEHTTSTNVAIRATGSDYAAMCLQTMVVDGTSEQHPDLLDAQGGSDINYDVITVEYSMNGIDGVPLLLRRLRDRYPDALIVYVHLWSLRNNIQDAKTGKSPRDILSLPAMKGTDMEAKFKEMMDDHEADWQWWGGTEINPRMHKEIRLVKDGNKLDSIANDVRDVGGIIYQLPLPSSPREVIEQDWFASDAHHLGPAAHATVARGILRLVDQYVASPELFAQPFASRKARLPTPTWGEHGGDQCTSWFDTGTPDRTAHSGGGQIRQFVKAAPGKFAHEVSKADRRPAYIEFNNELTTPIPVGITTMVWGGGDSGKVAAYPKANVMITRPGGIVDSGGVSSSPKGADGSIHHLNPIHRSTSFRVWHVTQTQFVGYAAPGKNVLTVSPVEETEYPLRVTGVVMCGACGLEEQGEVEASGPIIL